MNPRVDIVLRGGQLRINDTAIEFPVHRTTLDQLFGKPSRLYYRDRWRAAWDDLGIHTDYASWETILRIDFIQKPHPEGGEDMPTGVFRGTLSVDGEDVSGQRFDPIRQGKAQVSQRRHKGTGEPVGFSLVWNALYREPVPEDKYVIRVPDAPVIDFQDFNFKLLVLDELMYKQDVLVPRFDLYEFMEWHAPRRIDIDVEGYAEIEEVTRWFRDLPVTVAQAANVQKLQQDGGNRIYCELLRHGTGEEDGYDIIQLSDALQFPNLKRITLFAANTDADAQQRSIDEVRAAGIDVRFF